MFITYAIIAVVAVIVVRLLRKFLAYRAVFNNFPGEKDFSILTGNMHMIPGHNDAGLAYDIENARKYKYFHRVWAGPLSPMLMLYHPDVVKPVLKSHAPKPRNKIFATAYDMVARWLGEGLILANGNRWARNRRLLTPAFHFDILKSYLDVYNKCTDVLMKKLSTFSEKGQSCELYSAMNMHTLDVILRCAFSYNSGCQNIAAEENTYVVTVSQIESMWSKRSLQPHLINEFIYSLTADGRKFYQLCDVAHKFADDVIEKRKKELKDPIEASKKKPKDFLDILLSARDEDGKELTPLELRNEVDTFLFAGHDTTASGISWTLHDLAGHADYQDRVYDEVLEVLGDKEDVEWDDLTKLEYTSMCIKEAVRLHGTVPLIERHTSEEMTIDGHKIPIGTWVRMHLYTLHNNPHVWDDADTFQPDRFHPDKQRHMNPFQFVPFSAGSRNCIGQNFAMNEMKATVAKIIRKFKLTLDPKHKVLHAATITMKPETGMYLYLTPRP